MGVEPSHPAWKAGALPLSYTRLRLALLRLESAFISSISQLFSPTTRLEMVEGGWIRTNVGIANGFTARPL